MSVLLKVKDQLINLETTVKDSDLDLSDSAPLLPLVSPEPCYTKVRFKRLDPRFLEIGALRVVFTKRDPDFQGISGQVV